MPFYKDRFGTKKLTKVDVPLNKRCIQEWRGNYTCFKEYNSLLFLWKDRNGCMRERKKERKKREREREREKERERERDGWGVGLLWLTPYLLNPRCDTDIKNLASFTEGLIQSQFLNPWVHPPPHPSQFDSFTLLTASLWLTAWVENLRRYIFFWTPPTIYVIHFRCPLFYCLSKFNM